MSEWHEHLGEPLKYEEDETVARYEGNPWAEPHKEEPGEPKRINDVELYHCFLERLKFAEAKHPIFAEGPYEALGFIGQEFGELATEITKRHDSARWFDEALDLLVVTWRFARNDWKAPESTQGDPV